VQLIKTCDSTGTTTTTAKRKPAFDPSKQWGLKPADGSTGLRDADGGATYIISGHVVSGSARSSLFLSEEIGREGQAKAARRAKGKQEEKALSQLMKRDGEGMKAVVRAREVGLKVLGKGGKEGEMGTKGKGKEKADEPEEVATSRKNAFSASVVKQLGFDPTAKPGGRRVEETDVKKKVCSFDFCVLRSREVFDCLCYSSRLCPPSRQVAPQ
jgi:minichromosome maintenance protein 10